MRALRNLITGIVGKLLQVTVAVSIRTLVQFRTLVFVMLHHNPRLRCNAVSSHKLVSGAAPSVHVVPHAGEFNVPAVVLLVHVNCPFRVCLLRCIVLQAVLQERNAVACLHLQFDCVSVRWGDCVVHDLRCLLLCS